MTNILKTLVFATVFVAFVIVFVPLRWILPPGSTIGAWYQWLGLVPLATGATIMLWCFWDFATRGQGTPAPIDPPKHLVTRGLYRYVRNPMYIGALGVLLGWSLLWGSLAIAGYAVFFAVMAHLFVIFYEEWTLAHRFGDAYAEYKRAVPRWIPKFRG